MSSSTAPIRDKLIDLLKESDDRRREKRADRIIWMGTHKSRPCLIMGRPETLALLSEAEEAFREGHFISVQLLALAYLEHNIVEELLERSLTKDRVKFVRALQLARENEILEAELIERIDRLRKIRNPFVHLRRNDDPDTFGNRYISRETHPLAMLEDDAREAFKVMYLVFSALLKVD